MRCRQSARAWGLQARACQRAVPPLGREPMAQCREALTGGQEAWQERRERLLAASPQTERWPGAICSHHLDSERGLLQPTACLTRLFSDRLD